MSGESGVTRVSVSFFSTYLCLATTQWHESLTSQARADVPLECNRFKVKKMGHKTSSVYNCNWIVDVVVQM